MVNRHRNNFNVVALKEKRVEKSAFTNFKIGNENNQTRHHNRAIMFTFDTPPIDF